MALVDNGGADAPEYSKLLIVGAGMSGISAAAYYKRKYGEDFVIYERQKELGGTWWMNSYPGCGVDIPTVLYSFSYFSKHNWTQLFARQPEIIEYCNKTAVILGIKPRIRFSTDVEACEWVEETKRWRVHLRRRKIDSPCAIDAPTEEEDMLLEKGDRWFHECKVLISCVGGLQTPKDCTIPGHANFKGTLFHSARWDHRVDLTGKDVIVIGNGCSAAQLVPEITQITKSTTQFMRSAQWILTYPSPEGAFMKYIEMAFSWVPGLRLLARLGFFMLNEIMFLTFKTTKLGTWERKALEKHVLASMRSRCPEKYHDLILPKYPLGCKRRIQDNKYLETLNRPNMLLTGDAISHIDEDSVVTSSGKRYHADVIIMANGFQTGVKVPFKLIGKGGVTMEEHFKEVGGPGAYKTCALNGFPNFFMTFGPNTATGYTSLLVTLESVVSLAMNVAEPVFRGEADEVEVTRKAELDYREFIHRGLKDRVWSNSFCTSWYIDENGNNINTYPYSQLHLTLDLMFKNKKDWVTQYTPTAIERKKRRVRIALLFGFTLFGLLVFWRCFANQETDLQQTGGNFHRVLNMAPKFLDKAQSLISRGFSFVAW